MKYPWTTGGVKLFSYPTPADRCILLRTGEDEFNAFNQKCTHLSCGAYYERETNGWLARAIMAISRRKVGPFCRDRRRELFPAFFWSARGRSSSPSA